MPDDCVLCRRLAECRAGTNPNFVHEFPHSVLVVGDHQYHPGYCVLLLKQHVRELHDLAPDLQHAMFSELMAAGRAVAQAFRPWKMNYSCYGNQVPHIHWHLFPRYESDPDRLQQPWAHSDRFSERPTTPEIARQIAERLRPLLERGH